MKTKRTGKEVNGRYAVRPARLGNGSRFDVNVKDDAGHTVRGRRGHHPLTDAFAQVGSLRADVPDFALRVHGA